MKFYRLVSTLNNSTIGYFSSKEKMEEYLTNNFFADLSSFDTSTYTIEECEFTA